MKYFKLLFPLIALSLYAVLVSAQANTTQSVTIAPSSYPDKATRPAVVIANPQERSTVSENDVHYESVTVVPESKLSIGRASAVPAAERGNQVQPVSEEKNKINYSEQKIEKQEAPASSPSINPK